MIPRSLIDGRAVDPEVFFTRMLKSSSGRAGTRTNLRSECARVPLPLFTADVFFRKSLMSKLY